jgi:hypothetical protein
MRRRAVEGEVVAEEGEVEVVDAKLEWCDAFK